MSLDVRDYALMKQIHEEIKKTNELLMRILADIKTNRTPGPKYEVRYEARK